jgi:hypothetical protein
MDIIIKPEHQHALRLLLTTRTSTDVPFVHDEPAHPVDLLLGRDYRIGFPSPQKVGERSATAIHT